MHGYISDIETLTEENENFRQVLFTGPKMQLVLMCLQPGEEIGSEVHCTHDQFFRVEVGEGKLIMDGEEHALHDDWAAIVPAGTKHNIINTSSDQKLKLYTIYAPPEHPEGTVHATKAEADAHPEE